MAQSDAQQSFRNHVKLYPLFHFFVLPVLAINMIRAAVQVFREFSLGAVWGFVVALAVLGLALAARIMVLTVQDRLIRLEMRLRLRDVLPGELRARIPELTRNQLVAMRFASDAELPALARKVLDEKLEDRKAIKKLVQNWQPDYLRA
jgi:Family of unknown function (DUF6526)